MCNNAVIFSWIVVFAVEFLAIVVGNIITIAVFWKLRLVLKRTYFLLINLTIADLIVGFGVFKLVTDNIFRLESSAGVRWTRYIALDVFSGTASVTSLLLIAAERFFAIVFPFRHRVLTKRLYFKCIAGVWATSVLITTLNLTPGFFDSSFFVSFSRWSLASFTIICLIAICCFYTAVLVFSRKENPRIPRDKREQTKRLAKTLFIMTVLTLTTWIPLAVATIFPQKQEPCVIPGFLFAGLLLQMTNSALNPLVYCYRMPEFRAILKHNVIKCGNKTANTESRSNISK